MPARQVFHLSEDAACKDAFAVLPSWNQDVIGVKAFTYFPDNGAHQLPSLFSKILLFKRDHGEPLAMVDGTSVTYWRTAAVSALAAQVDVAQQNLAVTRETLDLTRQRFEAGVSDNIEVVQAQESVSTAAFDHINSVFAHNIAKLSLARALGRTADRVRDVLAQD